MERFLVGYVGMNSSVLLHFNLDLITTWSIIKYRQFIQALGLRLFLFKLSMKQNEMFTTTLLTTTLLLEELERNSQLEQQDKQYIIFLWIDSILLNKLIAINDFDTIFSHRKNQFGIDWKQCLARRRALLTNQCKYSMKHCCLNHFIDNDNGCTNSSCSHNHICRAIDILNNFVTKQNTVNYNYFDGLEILNFIQGVLNDEKRSKSLSETIFEKLKLVQTICINCIPIISMDQCYRKIVQFMSRFGQDFEKTFGKYSYMIEFDKFLRETQIFIDINHDLLVNSPFIDIIILFIEVNLFDYVNHSKNDKMKQIFAIYKGKQRCDMIRKTIRAENVWIDMIANGFYSYPITDPTTIVKDIACFKNISIPFRVCELMVFWFGFCFRL